MRTLLLAVLLLLSFLSRAQNYLSVNQEIKTERYVYRSHNRFEFRLKDNRLFMKGDSSRVLFLTYVGDYTVNRKSLAYKAKFHNQDFLIVFIFNKQNALVDIDFASGELIYRFNIIPSLSVKFKL